MRHILIFLLCFVLAGLLLVANSGRADDAPIEITGGAASPIAFPHQSIRMDSEEATIRLHKKSYTVDAVFRFFNTGETLTEWVGFPKRSMGTISSLPRISFSLKLGLMTRRFSFQKRAIS